MKCLRSLMMLSLLLITGNAFGMKVKTDYDRSFDFGRLKTFAFEDQRRPDGNLLQRNTLENDRIRDALKRDLEKRGFRYQPDVQADFLIAYCRMILIVWLIWLIPIKVSWRSWALLDLRSIRRLPRCSRRFEYRAE